MAERYNPVVRERQREHVLALMQQDRDALFRTLDKNICEFTILGEGTFELDFIRLIYYHFKPNQYPSLALGNCSWRFYVYMRWLQTKVCKEWKFCEKVRDPRNADRVELATQLADFFVDNWVRRGAYDLPAAILMMFEPKELCGCEDE